MSSDQLFSDGGIANAWVPTSEPTQKMPNFKKEWYGWWFFCRSAKNCPSALNEMPINSFLVLRTQTLFYEFFFLDFEHRRSLFSRKKIFDPWSTSFLPPAEHMAAARYNLRWMSIFFYYHLFTQWHQNQSGPVSAEHEKQYLILKKSLLKYCSYRQFGL